MKIAAILKPDKSLGRLHHSFPGLEMCNLVHGMILNVQAVCLFRNFIKEKFNFYFMYSDAWRRRRAGLGLTNRHSAQAPADVMQDLKDKDVPETEHDDRKNGDEAEDVDDEEIRFAI